MLWLTWPSYMAQWFRMMVGWEKLVSIIEQMSSFVQDWTLIPAANDNTRPSQDLQSLGMDEGRLMNILKCSLDEYKIKTRLQCGARKLQLWCHGAGLLNMGMLGGRTPWKWQYEEHSAVNYVNCAWVSFINCLKLVKCLGVVCTKH